MDLRYEPEAAGHSGHGTGLPPGRAAGERRFTPRTDDAAAVPRLSPSGNVGRRTHAAGAPCGACGMPGGARGTSRGARAAAG